MVTIKLKMLWKNITFDLILHALLLFIFLAIFLFVIIVKIEKDEAINALKSPVNEISASLVTKMNDLGIDKRVVHQFGKQLERMHSTQKCETKMNNKSLLYIVIAIGVLMAIALIFFGMRWSQNLNFKQIAIENIVIFVMIAALEVFFFLTVAMKYQPIESSDLQKTLLESVKYNLEK